MLAPYMEVAQQTKILGGLDNVSCCCLIVIKSRIYELKNELEHTDRLSKLCKGSMFYGSGNIHKQTKIRCLS